MCMNGESAPPSDDGRARSGAATADTGGGASVDILEPQLAQRPAPNELQADVEKRSCERQYSHSGGVLEAMLKVVFVVHERVEEASRSSESPLR